MQTDVTQTLSLNEFEFKLTTSIINGIINEKLEDNDDNKLFPFENAFNYNKNYKCKNIKLSCYLNFESLFQFFCDLL